MKRYLGLERKKALEDVVGLCHLALALMALALEFAV